MNRIIAEKDESKSRQLCPAGIVNSVCIAVYDLGKQPTNNVEWEPKQKIAILFETEEKMTEGSLKGENFRLSKIVTLSINEKSTLAGILKTWLGAIPKDDFDVTSLIGKPCTLTIGHEEREGKTYAVISAISPKMKNAETMKSAFDPDSVPEWIQKIQEKRLDKDAEENTVAIDTTTGPLAESKHFDGVSL